MNGGRFAFANVRRTFTVKGRAGTRRWFGADPHGQPEPQSMKAELWEGHPKGEEGWERITQGTYIMAAILLGVAYGFAPETSIQTWANNEAKARMKLKASGKITEFEFGKHYNTVENVYDFEKLDQKGYYDPFDEGSDDDEDEDEVDEEEEGTEDEDE